MLQQDYFWTESGDISQVRARDGNKAKWHAKTHQQAILTLESALLKPSFALSSTSFSSMAWFKDSFTFTNSFFRTDILSSSCSRDLCLWKEKSLIGLCINHNRLCWTHYRCILNVWGYHVCILKLSRRIWILTCMVASGLEILTCIKQNENISVETGFWHIGQKMPKHICTVFAFIKEYWCSCWQDCNNEKVKDLLGHSILAFYFKSRQPWLWKGFSLDIKDK